MPAIDRQASASQAIDLRVDTPPHAIARRSTANDDLSCSRLLVSLPESGRLNHRMHNELFVAGGAIGVIGGRNVASEYFLHSAHDNVVDLDASTVGFGVSPAAGQL